MWHPCVGVFSRGNLLLYIHLPYCDNSCLVACMLVKRCKIIVKMKQDMYVHVCYQGSSIQRVGKLLTTKNTCRLSTIYTDIAGSSLITNIKVNYSELK